MATSFPVSDSNRFAGIDFFREGMPLRSIATTTTGNFTNGQAIVGYSPTPTMLWWIEDITLSSNMDAKVDVSANGALLGYTYMNKTTNLKANVSQVIPIKQWVPEGQSVNVVARENLTGLSLDSGVSGYRNTNDTNYGALYVIETMGDSITNTIGATYLEGFYNGILRDSFLSIGQSVRLLNKGNGSFTTTNMEYVRATGQLNINKASLILYMLGTNDNNLATFQANFNAIVAWKKKWFPQCSLYCYWAGSVCSGACTRNKCGILQGVYVYYNFCSVLSI